MQTQELPDSYPMHHRERIHGAISQTLPPPADVKEQPGPAGSPTPRGRATNSLSLATLSASGGTGIYDGETMRPMCGERKVKVCLPEPTVYHGARDRSSASHPNPRPKTRVASAHGPAQMGGDAGRHQAAGPGLQNRPGVAGVWEKSGVADVEEEDGDGGLGGGT